MFEPIDDKPPSATAPPSTIIVVVALLLAAAVFSYLAAYAIAGALVSADLIRAWPPEADPRPRWFLTSFIILVAVFMLVAGTARMLSRRSLSHIDAIDTD